MSPTRSGTHTARLKRSLTALALAFACSRVVEAHHGRDFLLARTAELPHPGQVFFVPRQDVIRQDPTTSIELEPSLIFGAGERVAVEVHSHIARRDASGFHYESTAPAIHFRFTPDDTAWGVGASVEYEISGAADESNHVETRVAVSRQTEKSRLALNLIAGHGGVAEGTDVSRSAVDWNYAAGFRRRLTGKVDWGVEGEGGLSGTAAHEVLAGIYTEPSDHVTINVGAGVGLGPNAPGLTVRTALVLRLR